MKINHMTTSLNSLALINPLIFGQKLKCVKRNDVRISATRGDDRYGRGRIVDENMFVLRERIHEIKLAQEGDELIPEDWMDWEKRYYAYYSSDVCEAVGMLQGLLLRTRPSLALGIVAVIALSVPTSMGVVLCHLVEIAKNIG